MSKDKGPSKRSDKSPNKRSPNKRTSSEDEAQKRTDYLKRRSRGYSDSFDPKVASILNKTLTNKGLAEKLKVKNAEVTLRNNWAAIVGEAVARFTLPLRLINGTLQISVNSPAWSTELNYQKDIIMKKVNDFLGSRGLGITAEKPPATPSTARRGPGQVAGQIPGQASGPVRTIIIKTDEAIAPEVLDTGQGSGVGSGEKRGRGGSPPEGHSKGEPRELTEAEEALIEEAASKVDNKELQGVIRRAMSSAIISDKE